MGPLLGNDEVSITKS